MKRKQWESLITLCLQDGPKSIKQMESLIAAQITEEYQNLYEAVKYNILMMFYRKKLDRIRMENGHRLYQNGSGETLDSYIPTSAAMYKRTVREAIEQSDAPLSKVPKDVSRGPNGGRVVHLTDEVPFEWGGQINGYGKRTKGVLAD
jgi:hypothetical protein